MSGANPGSGAADVAVAADGRALVVWSSQSKIQANVRAPGGTWRAVPFDLAVDADCCAQAGIDASGTAYVAYEACTGQPVACYFWVRTLPAGAATWTDPQQISSALNRVESMDFAVAPSGASMVVWNDSTSGIYTNFARFRASNGALDPIEVLSNAPSMGFPRPTVAFGGNGNAYVAWEHYPPSSFGTVDALVLARVRLADGTWTTTNANPRTLGGPYNNNFAYDPRVAADPNGNGLVTWRADNGVAWSAAVTPAGAWEPSQPLSPSGNTSAPWPALDPAGTATVAWCEPAPGGWVVKVSRRVFGQSFGTAFTVSATEGEKCLPRTAGGPGGAAAVAWRRFDGIIRANVMPPGGSFGAAHDLSTLTGASGANYNASIAFDGAGDAVATWQRAGAVEAAAYDAAAPEARGLSIPSEGAANAPLSFAVSPFDIWSAVGVSWDFGDGVASGEAATTHAYRLAGRYDVTLTVTDAVGNASQARRTIVITAPATIDRDGDGFPAGLDCDDNNAAIRPGGTEIPGNAIDEDCNRVAAPAPKVTAKVEWSGKVTRRGLTRFDRLRVSDLQRIDTVQLRCRGKRCTFKRKTAKRGRGTTVNLLPLLGKRRTVRAGVTLEVWVRAPNHIAKVVRFRTTRRKFPTGTVLCVPLGATSPQKVCR